MRILLLYPPPWKIPAPGQEPDTDGEGPPRKWNSESRFCGDELTIPYGLLTLAAQAKRAGHRVTVLNLYAFCWKDVEELIRRSRADVYGLSVFTSNRRGSLSMCRLIRDLYPQSFIVAGGPHASALPLELLEHCDAINAVVIGEGELTFIELIGRLENGSSLEGLTGISWRAGDCIQINAPRERIHDLDSLASPYDYCKGHILITSRGCPGRCTYCGSTVLWGSKVRFHSAEHTLSVLDKMVRTHGTAYINIKDDTFTSDRKRVLEICNGIVKRELRFLWSCDTRVDSLDEEVLIAMRRAGCQMISLGIESASPEILRNINKRTTPEKALLATDMAKQFGFHIRYYMMACNRGETAETLKASIDFISKANPNEFIFAFLTLYPGTHEFAIAAENARASKEMFFIHDQRHFNYFPEDDYSEEMKKIIHQISAHAGVVHWWDYGVPERQKVLNLFPELAAAHMDLGKAYFLAGDLADAEECVRRALEMGFPLPGLGHNYLAAICVKQGNIRGALVHLAAAKKRGHFFAVDENLRILRKWISEGGLRDGSPPEMVVYHDFETIRSGTQPVVPAPITMYDQASPEDRATLRLIPVQ